MADTGTGIAPEDIERFYDPVFEQCPRNMKVGPDPGAAACQPSPHHSSDISASLPRLV